MRVPLSYIGVVLIWSTTPLAITYSVDSVDFIPAVALRMWLSLALCVLLLKGWGIAFPFTRSAMRSYAAGALGVTGGMLCVYWAANIVPSGLIAVIWGLLPMLVSLYSQWLLPGSHLSYLKLWSIALALAGLSMVFSGQLTVALYLLPGLMVLLLGVNLHAASTVMLVKENAPVHPLAQTAGALLLSAPIYGIAWWVTGSDFPYSISAKSAWAILYLSVMGSVIGFVAYFYLLKKMSAATVSLTTLITPVLALMLGSILEQEQLSMSALLGTGVIMLGLILYHWSTIRPLLLGRSAQ